MNTKRDQLKNMVSEVLEGSRAELYLLRWEKKGPEWVLEVLIDKDGPVTTSDCVNVSKQISAELDKRGLIERKFELQVSSPGAKRPLVESRHFKDAVGSEVEVNTYGPIEGSKKFVGILKSYDQDEDRVEMEVEGERVNISLSNVAKASTKLNCEEF